MELVVVERVYEQPLTDELVEALKRRAGPCFELRRITHHAAFEGRSAIHLLV